ncbi:Mce protein [Mycolicibacillus parakoreensis]|uniref:Mce protein n=1 Tax=Mycolicibacillus parakoreensis TaxID=1069221 RepID=A0ABY3U1S0_9MYCO|nr:Mce protein [Mycolicibacillus parakoreensis]MCV7315666.1 Mce protein [Mycolicibacillus parakoreensis]ULN51895.1 Mce protein [Mycolicibacillus parakoreensis]
MTAVVDACADEATEATSEVTASPSRRTVRLPRRVRRWLVAATAVVFVIGAGYQSWLLIDQHRDGVAGRDALAAAERYAVTLTTADPATIDDQVEAVIDGSTGDFHDRYTRHSADLRAMLLTNKVTTTGSIVDSAVKSADPHHATVLLLVRQSFTTPAMADRPVDSSADVTGMTMLLDNVDGRWLVSEIRATAGGLTP